MKRNFQLIVTASAASVLVFSAMGQDSLDSKAGRSPYSRDGTTSARRSNQLKGAVKASDIIGMAVKNHRDEALGTVEDLAVDLESGRIVQVILSTGGFLGIGETLTAVPPGALGYNATTKGLLLDADKEKLKSAPKFEMSKWSDSTRSNNLAEVYRHYGEQDSLDYIGDGNETFRGQPDPDRASEDVSAGRTDRAWDRGRTSVQRQAMIPSSRLGHIQKASQLMGLSVKNPKDETLGAVKNLLVDLTSGRIVAVIISSGGFLGMRDELSAVPPNALAFAEDRKTLRLDTTKERLAAAPHFKANQWPDLGQPAYADGVYRAYNVEPYFTANTITEADNTARNARDRNGGTLTPLDQGNGQADIDTTAQIRKEIVAGKTMSMNAKNVKIITNKGQVTLRGPVNSDEEKRLIGDIADRIAQSENVENHLEVVLTDSK